MRLIRKKSSQTVQAADKADEQKNAEDPWLVLIVDDEPDVLAVTRLELNNFRFMGRRLCFLEANSAAEARKLLTENPEIAIAIIDVVMETDDAGLQLVNYIRNKLGNTMTRLIIRTGQPGVAPEREVVERYDIDDYKDKTELTAQKLFTTVRTALKGYRDLCVINSNRLGLAKILDAAPTLYHPESMHEFFDGVLTQVIGLCNLGKGSCVTTVHNGAIITTKNKETVIQSSRGNFSPENKEWSKKLELCAQALMRGEPAQEMPENVHLIPLEFGHEYFGLICLEYNDSLKDIDRDLVRIMVNQSASALKTISLYDDLKDAHPPN
ncbi:MAG: DUF3369 domain-containing protein, partial [Candidatus Electrothrix sp. ATG2]|nr:DUF3369 domain-containing protein [Candidatus Electrothrix sp. ATG2]